MCKGWTFSLLLILQFEYITCIPETASFTTDVPHITVGPELSDSADSGNGTTPDEHRTPVYFDITDALNNQNFSEIENVLNNTSHVYYSTDRPITEIRDLDWVVDFLHSYNPQLCLRVAFQMTTNRSDLDWRHIDDYLSTSTPSNDGESERFSTFKKLLCSVVLDFQLGSRQKSVIVNNESFLYTRKWDISFTKYAKKITREVFKGKDIPVGVAYNEIQLEKHFIKSTQILHEQEIKHSDFLLFNVEHSPITEMPMFYHHFRSHYRELSRKNDEFLGISSQFPNLNFTGSKSKLNVQYMVTWNNWDSSSYPRYRRLEYEAVVNSSEHEYLTLFQKYVAKSVKHRNINIGVISGSNFNLKRESRWMHHEDDLVYTGRHVLPYLHFHDADTSFCSARYMLNHLGTVFDDEMAVNEFTWSALARNGKELVEPPEGECLKLKQGTISPPENVVLFASDGIGAHWNKTKQSFINLMGNHSRVAGMNLRTIVFSGNDLMTENQENHSPTYHRTTTSRYQSPGFNGMSAPGSARDTGISSFVKSVAEENETAIGCLVDLTAAPIFEPFDILQYTQIKCNPIIRNMTVIVWRFMANSTLTSDSQFNIMDDEVETEHVLKSLFTMLAAKNVINREQPNVKVVFQLQTEDNNPLGPTGYVLDGNYKKKYHQMELKKVFLRWAKIHKVKFVRTFETPNV